MADGTAPTDDQLEENKLGPAGSSPEAITAEGSTDATPAPDSGEAELAEHEAEGGDQPGETDAAEEEEEYYDEYIEYKALPAEEVEVAYRQIVSDVRLASWLATLPTPFHVGSGHRN